MKASCRKATELCTYTGRGSIWILQVVPDRHRSTPQMTFPQPVRRDLSSLRKLGAFRVHETFGTREEQCSGSGTNGLVIMPSE